jgi:thioesterase domain-containing protein/acyl carrier protein
VNWHIERYGLTAADRMTQCASLGFDAAVWEIWPVLTVGASLHIVDDKMRLEPSELCRWLHKNKISLAFLPTPLAETVLEEGWAEESTLRMLLTGGDRLHAVTRKQYPFALINHYGPTENSVVSTVGEVAYGRGEVPAIGKPIANTQAYVLDGSYEPLPVGGKGELFLGGEGLARGYFNRPELTAEKFVPNPFGERAGERLYRTGDLVRWDANGDLHFLGRADDQVKLRGYRIELGEIENVLGSHETVEQAVVMVREDQPGMKRLAAYVVKKAGVEVLRQNELHSYLKERLPEHMVPSQWVEVESFPVTANGKIDREKLAQPDARDIAAGPRDLIELELVSIFESILKTESVDISDSFFDLGGHSLLAVQLASVIKQRMKVQLPLAVFFQHRSVEELAMILREYSAGPSVLGTGDSFVPGSPIVRVKGRGSRPPLFLVHGAGGSAFAFTSLARHLHPEQPLLVFQDPGVDAGAGGEESIELIAKEYVNAMRAVQLGGPYLLGGWSMGGVVAFEMARQLEQQKQRIGLLALVDAYLPEDARDADDGEEGDQIVFKDFLRTLGFSDKHLEAIEGVYDSSDQCMAMILELGTTTGLIPRGIDPAAPRRLFDVYRRHVRAFERFNPGPTDLVIHLWHAEESISNRSNHKHPRNGSSGNSVSSVPAIHAWQKYAAKLSVGRVPGDHLSLLREPNVQVLAEQLSTACLDALHDESYAMSQP